MVISLTTTRSARSQPNREGNQETGGKITRIEEATRQLSKRAEGLPGEGNDFIGQVRAA